MVEVRHDETGLPASALTPAADARHRRRGVAVLGWGLVVLSTVAVGWCIAQAVTDVIASREPSVLAYVAGTVAIFIWFVAVYMLVWMRRVLARNFYLAAEYPEALRLSVFFGKFNGVEAGGVLARICGVRLSSRRRRVPMLATLVADTDGFGIWRGGRHPREQYRVPWGKVGTIAAEYIRADSAFVMHFGVTIDLHPGEVADDVELPIPRISFLAAPSSGWLGRTYSSHAVIEAFAAAIERRRRTRDHTIPGGAAQT